MRRSMRDEIAAAMKNALRERRTDELSTLRMITAAIKDRDIAARGAGNPDGIPDADILGLLGKMIKQRQDSARAFASAGRQELADKELAEIGVIRGFMPVQMSEAEMVAAVRATIADLGARGLHDMGRVMGALKNRYAGQMDFARANSAVKAALAP
ncbi:MAG: GatB/YqeY domain-containing protein [Rhodobacteraceae bacterium]|nr:GatB/YqeY domain-containing protein [Paracoccaceae bacterium]